MLTGHQRIIFKVYSLDISISSFMNLCLWNYHLRYCWHHSSGRDKFRVLDILPGINNALLMHFINYENHTKWTCTHLHDKFWSLMIFSTYHANILWADIFVVSPTSTKHTSPAGRHVRGSISQLNAGLSYGITYVLIALCCNWAWTGHILASYWSSNMAQPNKHYTMYQNLAWINLKLRQFLPASPHFNIKLSYPVIDIPIIMIREFWHHLVFIMVIPILVRWLISK